MPSSTVRAALTGVAMSLAAASPAAAAPVKITDGTFVDASSDGRYVLTATKIIDRQAGTEWLIGGDAPAIALADHSRRVLVDYGTYLGGFDPDSASPKTFAFTVPTLVGDTVVQPGIAKFVKNGSLVVFDTKETTPRIVSYDISTNTTTVLMTDANLVDASEDGKVITFRKSLAALPAPANAAEIPFGATSLPAAAVGYLVVGQSPRIVAKSTWTQTYRPGFETGECAGRVADVAGETPTGLRISQNADGRYALYVTKTVYTTGDALRQGHTLIERVTAGGTSVISDAGIPPVRLSLTNDPVSGAFGLIRQAKTTFPLVNDADAIADDGTARETGVLPIPGAGGSYDSTAFYTQILPVNGGAGVIYTGAATTRDSFLSRPVTFVNEGDALGASATPWLGLPRSGDAVLTDATKGAATWATCDDTPAVGTIADYAKVTVTPVGNSAGKVALTLAPSGLVAAKSAQLKITWFGFPVWTKTTKTSGTITLPSLPAGFGGFKLTVAVAPADGSAALTTSAALRRTR